LMVGGNQAQVRGSADVQTFVDVFRQLSDAAPAPLPADVAGMSIGELKAALQARGLTHTGCVEKSDLVARLKEEAAQR
jgi:hypothetical protein